MTTWDRVLHRTDRQGADLGRYVARAPIYDVTWRNVHDGRSRRRRDFCYAHGHSACKPQQQHLSGAAKNAPETEQPADYRPAWHPQGYYRHQVVLVETSFFLTVGCTIIEADTSQQQRRKVA